MESNGTRRYYRGEDIEMDMKIRLAELRKSKGLTQKELAKLLCTNQSTISRIENNKCEISPVLMPEIVDYFNVSAKYIVVLQVN